MISFFGRRETTCEGSLLVEGIETLHFKEFFQGSPKHEAIDIDIEPEI